MHNVHHTILGCVFFAIEILRELLPGRPWKMENLGISIDRNINREVNLSGHI